MFNLQSKNTRKVTLWISIFLAFLSSIPVLVIDQNWVTGFIVFVMVFVLSFFLSSYLIKRFILNEIRLIYRVIGDTRRGKTEKDILNKSLEQVSKDAFIWTKEQKVEIEKLQNNVAFRKEFLMNLAHELKTPIFAIQGYLATLLDGELYNEEINLRFLTSAAKNADRLGTLVSDLDKISKLESNQIPIDKTKFIIQQLIRGVFSELEKIARDKNVQLMIKKGCEGDMFVMADREKIKQVLINLIENGIKYGKEGGTVQVGIYELGTEKRLIEISDDGIGIPENMLKRVFERFYRTDSARSRDKGGSGLGLAIVKHIVEAHGQNIDCRSKEGEGATFAFTLEKS